MFEELTYDKKKETVNIICSKELKFLLEKNPNSRVFEKRKGSIIVDHELKELDFIIYKNSEIILTNKDIEIDSEKLANLTNGNKKIKKSAHDHRVEKSKKLQKDDSCNLEFY